MAFMLSKIPQRQSRVWTFFFLGGGGGGGRVNLATSWVKEE